MMEIYLIRHGATIANEQKLYCGATDLPLSPGGAYDIKSLREQGIYPPHAQAYFTSGLARTQQTLDIICGPVHAAALPQLAECNFGDFEMQSYNQLKDRDDYQAWISDQTGLAACPHGENRRQFERRVLAGYKLLVGKSQELGTVLAVCHGGVIACIMEHIFPGEQNFYEWQPETGRGYKLEYDREGSCRYKKV